MLKWPENHNFRASLNFFVFFTLRLTHMCDSSYICLCSYPVNYFEFSTSNILVWKGKRGISFLFLFFEKKRKIWITRNTSGVYNKERERELLTWNTNNHIWWWQSGCLACPSAKTNDRGLLLLLLHLTYRVCVCVNPKNVFSGRK